MSSSGGGGFDLPGRRRRATLSLTPLIDVTFILLIFFMLVTQFDRYAPVDVTLSSSQLQPDTQLSEAGGIARKLVVEIRADGSTRYNGRDISLDSLADLISEQNNAVRIVLLKPDPDTPLQLLIDTLISVQKIPGLTAQIAMPPEPAPESGQEEGAE